MVSCYRATLALAAFIAVALSLGNGTRILLRGGGYYYDDDSQYYYNVQTYYSTEVIGEEQKRWFWNNTNNDTIINNNIINNNNNTKTIEVLIAKALGSRDIDDTIQDINAMTDRVFNSTHIISVNWKLFCYKLETYNKLKTLLAHHPYFVKNRISLHFGANQQKPYFWHYYLNSSLVPETTDYVWIPDGDIVLRGMNWQLFWKIVMELQPGIFAPSLLYRNGRAKRRQSFQTMTYPNHCHNNNNNIWTRLLFGIGNNTKKSRQIKSFVGIETEVIEMTAPAFRADAWRVVINNLDKVYVEHPTTAWGPDIMWCRMVEKDLFGLAAHNNNNNNNNNDTTNYYKGPKSEWKTLEKTCSPGPSAIPYQDFQTNPLYRDKPIACLIIHATPALHGDSRMVNRGHAIAEGPKAIERFEKAFPGYNAIANNKYYWRSFITNATAEEDFQTCVDWSCSPLGNHNRKAEWV